MKGCRQARRRILRAADQDLALERRFLLDDHLERCQACRGYRERVLRLEQLLVELPEPPRDHVDVEGAVASIRGALERGEAARDAARPAIGRPGERRRLSPLVALGGLACAAALVMILGRDRAPERPLAVSGLPIAPGASPITTQGSPGKEEPLQVAVSARPEPSTPDEVAAELRVWIVESFADRIGEDLRGASLGFEALDRRLGRWPLKRMAEDLLSDQDPRVARSAARYLGLRGDRVSVSRLRAALGRPEAAKAALHGLGDLGELAVGALGECLEEEEWREQALAALARTGTAAAAAAIEASLLRYLAAPVSERRADDPVAGSHLDALVRLGPPALASLLRVASRGDLQRLWVLMRLERVEGGAAELARLIEDNRRPSDVDSALLLEACGRLMPDEALGWVAERAGEHRTRALALRTLGSWGGTAPVATLLALEASGRVSKDDSVFTFRRLADRGEERLAELARALIAEGDALALGRYLDLLVASEHPAATDAVLVVALADLLPDDERQWAALAVGELGSPRHGRELARALGYLGTQERRLIAACLISIQRLLGEDGVREALRDLPSAGQRLVFEAMPTPPRGSGAGPTGPSRADAGAVALFRVARALGDSRCLPGTTLLD